MAAVLACRRSRPLHPAETWIGCAPMTNASVDLEPIALAWTDELARALQTRTAWSALGTVEIVEHTGAATLGGVIDRRLIRLEPGKPVLETVEKWRGTADGRIV